ncbi:hypothetical protein PV646_36780 [Streptomyces sp. ID05-26A]|nr:hypothetical protein [Streptomyces sp. ID05-26A]
MEVSVEIPLDPSGFMRRECPTCERQFKWFPGGTADKPDDFADPETYFCPYCGVPSGTDNWATSAQIEYAQSVAMGVAMEQIGEELRDTLGSSRSRGFKLKVSGFEAPSAQSPPHDPDDMIMVEPPCHPFEPLKVSDEWSETLHCLICGRVFRV